MMANKQRKRKKSCRAIQVTNKKNALQRVVKTPMEQKGDVDNATVINLLPADATENRPMEQKGDVDNATVINLLPADPTENRHMDIATSGNMADLSENSFITFDPVETQQTVTFTDTEETDYPLIIENELNEDEFQPVSGRRIVDLNYILKELQEKARHNGLFDCKIGNFRLVSEKRRGLLSLYRFECNMCKEVCLINSEDPNNKEQVNLNIAATTGIVASGIGFSQFQELSSAMDIPVFSTRYYLKLEDEVFEKWQETASASMEAAAQMEKDMALAEGRTKNGIPVIDVYVDGSWCARSYGTNYKASSGTAAIIGRRTGQVLYIGIKNKYCLVCARAEHKNMAPKAHKCFKNFEGSSSSMETEIIVEGFKASISMYGIIYERMIGDGDASTYAAILKARPYRTENVTVEKIECRNHILRNFCKKLRNLTTDTKYVLAHRKMLTNVKIMTMRKSIVQCIRYHNASESPRNVAISSLHNDIINCVAHAFGDHRMCQEYYCTKDKNDNEELKKIQNSTFIFRINAIVSNVASKSRSLVEDVNTNTVECFNSVIAKFIGGKRTNFALKGGYQGRCSAAVVSFNSKSALSTIQKAFLNKSPKGWVKVVERRRAEKRKLNLEHPVKKIRKLKEVNQKQHDYGPASSAPDMSPHELKEAKEEFLNNLRILTSDRHAIERATVLQRDSSAWLEIRKNLITASNFGQICKRKDSLNTAPLVKNILYQKNLSHVAAVAHGIENEKQALQQLQKQENINIIPCGVFIDKTYPFIGATPDGLVGDDMLVELKCPLTASKKGLKDAIEQNKIQIIKFDKKTSTSTIKKTSNWFYQIQGQLHVTERRLCLLGIWAGENEPLLTKRIERDDNFWKTKMEPKLVKFYMKCLLPEIVDSRQARGMPLRTLSLQDDKENVDSGDLPLPSPKPQMGNFDFVDTRLLPSPEPQMGNFDFVDSPSLPSPETHIGNIDSIECIHLSSPDPQLYLPLGISTRQINFAEF